MTGHLSTLQIKLLCVSALPEDELTAAAAHTAECPSCHRQFVAELRGQRGVASGKFNLNPESWFENDHLDFEQVLALVDQTLDQETEEIINIHLTGCESCREDVRSLRAFRDGTEREVAISYRSRDYHVTHTARFARWWTGLQLRPIYVTVAITLAVAAVLIGIAVLNNRDRLQANKATGEIEHGEVVSSSPTPSVISTPAGVDDSAELARLRDAMGDISIDKSGRIRGLDAIDDNNRQYVARAALSERIEAPEVLKYVSGEQSGLRGAGNGGRQFKLSYPLKRVIPEDRPVFRWAALSGATSYRVYVLDANGDQVAQSVELPSNQTQWSSPARLGRGHVFSWVVTALVDGKKIVSPSASDPEAKFAVLSDAHFHELTRLKTSRSHLALGVFFARTGLLNEAEREFQSLVKLNPDSELVRKLLKSLRRVKKELG